MESWYDKEDDILNIQIKEGGYWKSVELPNGIVIDISKDGSIVAFEVLHASKIFSGDLQNVLHSASSQKSKISADAHRVIEVAKPMPA